VLQVALLPYRFAICQLKIDEPFPSSVYQSSFYSITKTDNELSVVCEEDLVKNEIKKSGGWRLLKINSVLDLSLTGITAQFSTALAKAGVNLTVIATYNTDYIMVEEVKLEMAIVALREAGFGVGE
jgi:uncharacterized protein